MSNRNLGEFEQIGAALRLDMGLVLQDPAG